MSTEVVTIPDDNVSLHGVVHRPDPEPLQRVGVLISSWVDSGTKAGPHRLMFQVSEALAAAGFYALRFDHRGLCDSPGLYKPTIPDRIADTRKAAAYFRSAFRLDALVGWGMCAGGVLLLNCVSSPGPKEEGIDGLILCNLLGDPESVSPSVDAVATTSVRRMLHNGSLLRKLLRAPRKLHIYLRNLPKLAATLLRPYTNRSADFAEARSYVAGSRTLLAKYSGPMRIICSALHPGQKEIIEWKHSIRHHDWVIMKDAGETFASAEQKAQLIGHTIRWLEKFRLEQLPDSQQHFFAEPETERTEGRI